MNITPSTHILESIRSQRLTWKDVLGELFDNGFDADATEVKVYFDRDSIRVSDDGIGCADLHAMFTPGEHKPHPGHPGLGRFGIGFKDAALWLYGTTVVESVRSGKLKTARVDWPTLKEWNIDDPFEVPTDQPSGTVITFKHSKKETPRGKDLEALVKELEFIFAPAIKRGRRLVFARANGPKIIAQQFLWPERDHVIHGDVAVVGRTVHINVGIVVPGVQNTRAGLSYLFRHRVIIPASGLGCGNHNTSRILGTVELKDDEWRLSKNKNDIVELREELAEAVENFCRPVLLLADQEACEMGFEELSTQATLLLHNAISQGFPTEKAKREKGNTHPGGAKPTGTGSKHRQANQRQPGQSLINRLSPSLRIEFHDMDESDGIGSLEVAGNVVRLSKTHPYIAYVIALPAEYQRAMIFSLAISILGNHVTMTDSPQRVLPYITEVPEEKKFSVATGRLLKALTEQTAAVAAS